MQRAGGEAPKPFIVQVIHVRRGAKGQGFAQWLAALGDEKARLYLGCRDAKPNDPGASAALGVLEFHFLPRLQRAALVRSAESAATHVHQMAVDLSATAVVTQPKPDGALGWKPGFPPVLNEQAP